MRNKIIVSILFALVSTLSAGAQEKPITITSADVAPKTAPQVPFFLEYGDNFTGEGLRIKETKPSDHFLDPYKFAENAAKAILSVVDEESRVKNYHKKGYGVYRNHRMIEWKFGGTTLTIPPNSSVKWTTGGQWGIPWY